MNQAAFRWGRRAAIDPAAVEALVKPHAAGRQPQAVAILRRDGRAPRRVPDRLSERRLCGALSRAGRRGRRRPRPKSVPGKSGLAEAVARYLFKLMAYKDEYEVARLYTDGAFLQAGRGRVRGREAGIRIPSRAAAAGARAIRRPASRAR